MNHFLLPDAPQSAMPTAVYGTHAMELLVNAVMKAGGDRQALVAKTFGGANVSAARIGVGARNAKFVADFLRDEGIRVVAESLGGQAARRVWFHPATGKARMAFIEDASASLMPAKTAGVVATADAGEVQLFS